MNTLNKEYLRLWLPLNASHDCSYGALSLITIT